MACEVIHLTSSTQEYKKKPHQIGKAFSINNLIQITSYHPFHRPEALMDLLSLQQSQKRLPQ